jgi:hypothetical protein
MAEGVELLLVPGEHGRFPLSMLSPEEVERLANGDFASRDMRVVPDFFHEIRNLEFLLNGRKSDEGLIGSSAVLNDSTGGFNFLYVTKANVANSYYGNGLLNQMVDEIARIAQENSIPVVLRTSDERVHRKYAKSHDIYTVIGSYYVHGFGFQQKGTRMEMFSGARKLFGNVIAPYVAAKEPTVVPIHGETQLIYSPPHRVIGVHYSEKDRANSLRLHPFARIALGLDKPEGMEAQNGQYTSVHPSPSMR